MAPTKPNRKTASSRGASVPSEVVRFASKNKWRFFPIKPKSKEPWIKGWQTEATCDLAKLRAWATMFPGCNWGWAISDDYAVVDVDGDEGKQSIAELKNAGCKLPNSLTFKTAHGTHQVYKTDVTVSNSVSKLGNKIDTRANGGYIVFPGSTHPTGVQYKILKDVSIAKAPAWIAEKLSSAKNAPSSKRTKKSADRDVPVGERNNSLFKLGCQLHSKGVADDEVFDALHARNAEFSVPLADSEVGTIAKSATQYEIPSNVQATLNSERPKVMLSGDNRLVSDLASELGEHLGDKLYLRNDAVVTLNGSAAKTISAQSLRTFVEQFVVCCKLRVIDDRFVKVGQTMTDSESRGVLASEQFKNMLRPLVRINTYRAPVLRADGSIELLPEDYDAETGTMTVSEVEFDEAMTFAKAKLVIDDLFSEVNFADERSRDVAVADLIGMGAAQLLPKGSLRPAFIITKNAEGAGASTLAACTTSPFVGSMATSSWPDSNEEVRKVLTTAVMEAKTALVFDNVKSIIGGAAIEGFISAPLWDDRKLGSNESARYPNNATVKFTVNGANVTPDMRRRSLFVELRQEAERAEDREFRRPITEVVLRQLRPQILAAVWSFIRKWDQMGRPKASRSHSAFPEWAQVVGGIVEANGYGCPLLPAEIAEVADEDGDAMRALVARMKCDCRYSPQQLADVCRAVGAFSNVVGTSEFDMKPAQRSTFGKIFARYNGRMVGDFRFLIEGKFHQRKYLVVSVGNSKVSKVEQGVSPQDGKKPVFTTIGKVPCPTLLPCSSSPNDTKLARTKPKGRSSKVGTPPTGKRPVKFSIEGRRGFA